MIVQYYICEFKLLTDIIYDNTVRQTSFCFAAEVEKHELYLIAKCVLIEL